MVKHLSFRCGEAWCAWPALAVRSYQKISPTVALVAQACHAADQPWLPRSMSVNRPWSALTTKLLHSGHHGYATISCLIDLRMCQLLPVVLQCGASSSKYCTRHDVTSCWTGSTANLIGLHFMIRSRNTASICSITPAPPHSPLRSSYQTVALCNHTQAIAPEHCILA